MISALNTVDVKKKEKKSTSENGMYRNGMVKRHS